MENKEVYEEYGKAMVDLEMVQNRVQQLKQQINNILNTPKEVKENGKD